MIAAVVLGLYMGGAFPESSAENMAENWREVQVGMTKAEVRKLVGDPNGLSYGPLPPEKEFVDGYYIEDREVFYVHYIDGVVVQLDFPSQ